MAKRITVVVPHKLGVDQATQALRAQAPHIEAAFGKFAKLHDVKWSGNTFSYRAGAFGLSIPGTLAVLDDRVEVEADLPMLVVPFAQVIENSIRRHAAEIFANRELNLVARSAAEASGRTWAQLNETERARYRENARQQQRREG